MAENTYDAIVIGSGISGGWAAKELTEKGMKVLMLEEASTLNISRVIKIPIKILGVSASWW
jgi:choline dehydrogenase-like flavoprotein